MREISKLVVVVTLSLASTFEVAGQTTNGTLSGAITDPSGAVVAGAHVVASNADTNVASATDTNSRGIYTFASLPPGRYRLSVAKDGFRSVNLLDVVVHVQDQISQNFVLQVGTASESITVSGEGLKINTTDAAVSTVVDRQFVENMPLNGRSLQDLLTLAPGVLLVPSSTGLSGEISVNGQRTEANYFTVDGVSVNTGVSTDPFNQGASISGGLPEETVLGTTQNIVSIDALQEFRVSTSSYSAEYGRTPGGQFSFVTRSGNNSWHGSAYDYFRNEDMDANNWFNKCNCLGLPLTPRLPERQNDFGGTLGGPVIIPGLYSGKDKTFFFFSYEGLRLTVPQPAVQFAVPDLTMRQQAPTALQPFLNSFPIPNGGEDGLNDGLAFYNLAYSSPSSLDNFGIRIDHSFGDKLKIFGRYADSPSYNWVYGYGSAFKQTTAIKSQSLTLGATSAITSRQFNELRFNFTANSATGAAISTDFGGATPLSLSSFPGPNGQQLPPLGSQVGIVLCWDACNTNAYLGQNRNSHRQYNLVDTYTWSFGRHQLKFGVDWRRLTGLSNNYSTSEVGVFLSENSVLTNSVDVASNSSLTNAPVEPVYHNYSSFVQDEWKATGRLALSLGLRWDINPAPGNLKGPSPYTVDQITDLAVSKLAPANTPLWKTDWHGFAPRVGLTYQLSQKSGHDTVLRAGSGVFYDTGNTLGSEGFVGVGFNSFVEYFGVPYPLTSALVTLPPPSVTPPYQAPVYAFDPHLKLPYTLEWNLAVEQGLGSKQTLTVGYVGSGGRRLLTNFDYSPNALGNANFAKFATLAITSNRASSAYDALQVKYQRDVLRGLQVLASYTWSHSLDNNSSNLLTDELLRGSSDQDIRHNFQTAITYDVPGSYSSPTVAAVLKGWGLDTRVSARSALPVDIVGTETFNPTTGREQLFHPDVVPGQALYLYSSKYPGGRIINYNAFVAAPANVDGNAGRNYARGFDAVQVDLALRRSFAIHDRLKLQFRAEAFNLFNHPNFGNFYNFLGYGPQLFGYAYTTLNNQLGGLNPLYQTGGPRSLQLMLKLQF